MPSLAISLDAVASAGPITVEPAASLSAAAHLMDDHGFRHLPVVYRKRLCGMVSERDLLQALGDFHGRIDHQSRWRPDVAAVSDVMSTPVFALEASASLSDAARIMSSKKIGAIPIADGRGRPTAIVTETDLLAYCASLRNDVNRVAEFIAGSMQTELVTIGADEKTAAAVSTFFQRHLRHLPVIEDDALVGLISDRDVRRIVGESVSPEHALQRPVRQVMSPKPVTARPDFSIHDAADMMHQLKLSALPVMEGPELLGIITITDILRHLAEVSGGVRLGGVPALRCSLRDGEVQVEPVSLS